MKVLTTYPNVITMDWEFYENGETIVPISVGMVRVADGKTLYCVNEDFDKVQMVQDAKEKGSEETISFLDKSVFPYLNATSKNTMGIKDIANSIIEFSGKRPTFWASTGCYDWVAFCQLFGRMVDLPKDYPYFVRDTAMLKSMLPKMDIDYSPMKNFNGEGLVEHNALYDAATTMCKYLTYKKFIQKNRLPITI